MLINDLKSGDIIFTFKSKNIISKLIAWFSTSFDEYKIEPDLSSVKLYLGNELIIGAFFEGIQIKHYSYLIKNNYSLMAARVNKNFNVEDLIKSAETNAGNTKYAYWQLFVIAIEKIFNIHKIGDVQKDAVICTEFIINEFKKVGVDLLPGVDASEATPVQLYNSLCLQYI